MAEQRKERYLLLAEASEATHKLGIKTRYEYSKRYKDDPRLPCYPVKKYAKDWVGWDHFLGVPIRSLYSTLAEASEATHKLGIRNATEYKKRYKDDPRLVCRPQRKYAKKWVGWEHFLGVPISSFYSTLAEASEAAKKLGIRNAAEYKKRYKVDPRLHSNPFVKYAQEWVDWNQFLGETERVHYPTLAEASEAAQKQGFRSSFEYRNRYKDDPRLPWYPVKKYAKDWVGWDHFLGVTEARLYSTLAEASEAAQKLGIINALGYKKRYKDDPRLHSNPNRKYKQEWVDWKRFLGGTRVHYPTLAEASEAAKKLGIRNSAEYKKRYKVDPRLHSNPFAKYAQEWVDWKRFLGGTEKVFYSTLAEASEASQKLGIRSQDEYIKRYKEDPKLPSSHRIKYTSEWASWNQFLGKTERFFYLTLAEASEAVKKLGIRNATEYKKRHKDDPRLLSNPVKKYAKDWVGWDHFLGVIEGRFYSTLVEASEAAQKLGIRSQDEYKKLYKEDPKLPSTPRSKYTSEWASWNQFLGKTEGAFYLTLAEASEAVKKLGIRYVAEYKRRHKEDKLLPKSPRVQYSKEWGGFPAFLGTAIPNNEPLNGAFWEFQDICPEWKLAAEKFVIDGVNQSAKVLHLRQFLKEIVIPSGFTQWPAEILDHGKPFSKKRFEAFINSIGESSKQSRYSICLNFMGWVLDEYCSEENDNGELIRLPGFRNPIATLMGHLADQFQPNRPSESVKPVLPMSVIARARNHLIPNDCKTFADLSKRHSFLEDAWFEVEPSVIDENDPDCVWREHVVDRKIKGNRYREKVIQIWSPVKSVALYTLLMVPLRGQQIVWLDSGESDTEIPIINGLKIEWVKNTLPLAGYKSTKSFIKKYPDGQSGMHVTTNKTGGRAYDVPYMPDDLAFWIIRLRDWQAKYNPLEVPTPWTKISLRQRINKNILKARGSQTFLFRDPCNRNRKKGDNYSPMMTTTAFYRSLAALLAAIQGPGEELAELDPLFKTKKEYKSLFTTHSLRTSIITALIVDGGAPVDVVMKLVGHATIVMTLYYTKVGPSRMKAELAEAEKRALQTNVDWLRDLAFTKQIESAKSHLIATDSDFLGRIDSDWPAVAYQFMDWGMCPMSGQSCDNGGDMLRERTTETVYAPVEAGYLGKRNCPRCRFFITGPAFLGGLQALANEISLEVNAVTNEYNDLITEQERLENEKFDAECEGKLFEHFKDLNQTISAAEERGHKLNVFLTDWQHVFKLVRQSLALMDEDSSDDGVEKQQLIINEQLDMDVVLEESTSEFRLLASICKDAEFYQATSSSRALPKLAQMIDNFAENSGIKPGLYRLTEKQQLMSANQITSFLLKRLNGDWNLTEQVVLGNISLSDLSSEEALLPLKTEITHALRGEVSSLKKIGDSDVKH